MYSVRQIQRAVRNPRLLAHEALRLYHTRGRRRNHNPDGVQIFEKDWDNLVILDACRYDMFNLEHDLPGTLKKVTSAGASTPEFLAANFDGRDLRDTVYTTANPHLYRNKESYDVDLFAEINVWQEDGWNDDYGTVLPETTTKYAKQAVEEYPNKRHVVHYMQPHYPFLTDSNDFFDETQEVANTDAEDFWTQQMASDLCVPREKVWNAYCNNLDAVLPHVSELLELLDGKTVVTSDHGNMVGERATPIPIREWGHPPGIYTKELVEVPWLVHESGQRREIIADDPVETASSIDSDVVDERLKRLGYKT